VDLQLREGKIVCLLGENGAGKSTLMKVLTGVHTEFEGHILLDGKPVRFKNTKEAFAQGKPNSPARILGTVSSEDRGEQVAETFLEFRATSRVVHFDTLAFATDQAGLAQDFEMLGEGRLGQGAVFDLAEVGAIQGAF
jgi:ABC-type cobalamin/Fe3+-siderophores transport system ATPase subunit